MIAEPETALSASQRSLWRRIGRGARKLGLLATALLPMWAKRVVYRRIWGFHIAPDARIGLAYLDCAELSVGDEASIGHGVVFWGCGRVAVGRRARIGPLNLFRGGQQITLGDYALVLRLNVVNAIPEHDCIGSPESVFSLGYGAVLTAGHRIDCTDRVTFGRCAVLGGRNSSLWTHNKRTTGPITIGDYVYCGSEIRIAPGSSVPDCCVVGLGAVVTEAHAEPFSLLAGVPARRIRALTGADADLIFGKTRPDLPDQDIPGMPVKTAPDPMAQPARQAFEKVGRSTTL